MSTQPPDDSGNWQRFTLPSGQEAWINPETNEAEVIEAEVERIVNTGKVIALAVLLLGVLLLSMGVGGVVGTTVNAVCGLWAGIGTLGASLVIVGLLSGQ